MSIFDGNRIPGHAFNIDVTGLRKGLYSDKYFLNTAKLLGILQRKMHRKEGHVKGAGMRYTLKVGDIEVEAQIFNRKSPFAIVAGVDHALAQLRKCAGTLIESAEPPSIWLPASRLQGGSSRRWVGHQIQR